ncbi:MAG: hypothetical protein HY655_00705 [Acidobacteria bacterium]|nr:hypothetical protein [Acidobacteriota bacterium]
MGARSAAVVGFVTGCVVAAGTALMYAWQGAFAAALTFGGSVAAIGLLWYLAQHPRVARWLALALGIAAAAWFVGVTALPVREDAGSGRWSLGDGGRFLEALTTVRALLVVIAILLFVIAQRLARLGRSVRR